MEWISVKDSLPTSNDDMLLYSDSTGNMYVGYYRDDARMWDSCESGWIKEDITHWMPLSSPLSLEE